MWWCRAVKFFVVWTGQAVWVWVTLLPVLILNATERTPRRHWTDVVGGIIWGAGFICELTADLQKQQWRKDPAHKGRFINVGDGRPFRCIRYWREHGLQSSPKLLYRAVAVASGCCIVPVTV